MLLSQTMANGTSSRRTNSDFASNMRKMNSSLKAKNKWMGPSDFNIPRAEAALEAKLQKYDSGTWDLNRYHLASQAACNDNLWSHIDTFIQRGKLGDKVIYLVRWKLCWTPQSN